VVAATAGDENDHGKKAFADVLPLPKLIKE
jgi:hypothetical protein